jgi:hypothetical protein
MQPAVANHVTTLQNKAAPIDRTGERKYILHFRDQLHPPENKFWELLMLKDEIHVVTKYRHPSSGDTVPFRSLKLNVKIRWTTNLLHLPKWLKRSTASRRIVTRADCHNTTPVIVWRIWRKPRSAWIIIADIPVRILIKTFLNRSQERYR